MKYHYLFLENAHLLLQNSHLILNNPLLCRTPLPVKIGLMADYMPFADTTIEMILRFWLSVPDSVYTDKNGKRFLLYSFDVLYSPGKHGHCSFVDESGNVFCMRVNNYRDLCSKFSRIYNEYKTKNLSCRRKIIFLPKLLIYIQENSSDNDCTEVPVLEKKERNRYRRAPLDIVDWDLSCRNLNNVVHCILHIGHESDCHSDCNKGNLHPMSCNAPPMSRVNRPN